MHGLFNSMGGGPHLILGGTGENGLLACTDAKALLQSRLKVSKEHISSILFGETMGILCRVRLYPPFMYRILDEEVISLGSTTPQKRLHTPCLGHVFMAAAILHLPTFSQLAQPHSLIRLKP